jgi:hypothetical protein
VAERSDAKLAQIILSQCRQQVDIDVVRAERLVVLTKSQPRSHAEMLTASPFSALVCRVERQSTQIPERVRNQRHRLTAGAAVRLLLTADQFGCR